MGVGPMGDQNNIVSSGFLEIYEKITKNLKKWDEHDAVIPGLMWYKEFKLWSN